jgi:hypothetical protein
LKKLPIQILKGIIPYQDLVYNIFLECIPLFKVIAVSNESEILKYYEIKFFILRFDISQSVS